MKTITLDELQEGSEWISTWIENGETVQIMKEGSPIAMLEPVVKAVPTATKPVKMPDFAARLKRLFPNEKVSPAGTIQEIIDYGRGH